MLWMVLILWWNDTNARAGESECHSGWESVLCTAASMASTPVPVAAPSCDNQNVSRHCQMSPTRQYLPSLRTSALVVTQTSSRWHTQVPFSPILTGILCPLPLALPTAASFENGVRHF